MRFVWNSQERSWLFSSRCSFSIAASSQFRTARDGAVTQITVIDAISHFEISERDLLSGVNEQESRMSTAQSGKTKSFRSLGSLSMLSSLPQPVIRDLDSKLILAKHSAGSV